MKNFLIFIFDRSIFNVRLLGTDLKRFSIKPPPVIWAAELIKFLFDSFKISFEYILVGSSSSFLISLFIFLLFFKIDLTNEKPFECSPFEGIARMIFFSLTLFLFKIFFRNYTNTKTS